MFIKKKDFPGVIGDMLTKIFRLTLTKKKERERKK